MKLLAYLILFCGGLLTIGVLSAVMFFLLPALLLLVAGTAFLYFLGLLMAWAADQL